jgi:Leucine-rich repeat (LRR) protein
LRNLVLSGNRLTALPPEIGQLVNLRDLDLTRNRLTTLPRELTRIHTFNSLDLDGNPWAEPLASVVPEPSYCPNIEAIYACLRRL